MFLIVNSAKKANAAQLSRKGGVTFVDCSREDEETLSRWLFGVARKRGLQMDADAAQLLVRYCAQDAARMKLETEKRNGGFQVPTSFKEALLLAAHQQELIEEQQKQIEQKDETIELQEAEIKKAAPKVDYYDKTLQSVNTQTTTQVAKSLGMDAHKLNRKLKEAGILYNQSGQWLLKQPYASWGLHATRTQTYTRSDGSTGTSTYTVWTEKGKRFIHALHDNDYDAKKAVRQIKGELKVA